MNRIFPLSLMMLSVIVCSCAQNKGRYQQAHDTPPEVVPKHIPTQDEKPKYEPYAPANLRPYTVRGVNYKPMATGKGYSSTGKASWYGQKFHGHLTANGETYDMFKMSAAHKTLPLPSFVRVTNLENGKQAIVRVNDRGPFHNSRLIDLSYAAALKLDMLRTGVSDVKVDVIHIDQNGQMTVGTQTIRDLSEDSSVVTTDIYIQVLALKDKSQIENIGTALQTLYQKPYKSVQENQVFKLRIGPLKNDAETLELLTHLKSNGYPGAYKIYGQ
ncbi:septal ring lytic transglycosylase RlpA family protein [Paraglaciecola sp. 2405UD69-4]|uniref:septal ring lytic transglycosylase RlpA family protein n=1 Tax=Paraglaciecola sp. 2405UD69-4 TaxID=3391836 RepID=UPI0039C9159A